MDHSIVLFLFFFYTELMKKNLYFDCAATALYDEAIIKNALEKSLCFFANPSSLHKKGLEAKQCLEACREKAAKSLEIPAEQLFFTSGGTEANQIAILSLLTRPSKGSILISAIEHPAVREQVKMLESSGWSVQTIPVNTEGSINLRSLREKLSADTALVSVMAVNNETGAIQPIEKIGALLQELYEGKRKPRFHVDAVQAIGKIPFSLKQTAIDSAALSAHKIGGPKGVGALYTKHQMESFLKGGNQEKGLRSGTENLFGIYAFADCLEKYAIGEKTQAFERYEKQKTLTAFFIEEVRSIKAATIIPEKRTGKEGESFSPWIVQAAFQNIPAQVLIRALSEHGVCISSGSACSSKKLSRPVLEAMNLPKEQIQNAVRFSFCPSHTREDIENLLVLLKNTVNQYG